MGRGLRLDFTRTPLPCQSTSVLILLDPVGGDQVNHEVSPTDSST